MCRNIADLSLADELAPWRLSRHHIGLEYIVEYQKHFPPSYPEDEFWDRNLLYCMYVSHLCKMQNCVLNRSGSRKFNLNSSAHYPGNLRFRDE